jgi:hypothetical protein
MSSKHDIGDFCDRGSEVLEEQTMPIAMPTGSSMGFGSDPWNKKKGIKATKAATCLFCGRGCRGDFHGVIFVFLLRAIVFALIFLKISDIFLRSETFSPQCSDVPDFWRYIAWALP